MSTRRSSGSVEDARLRTSREDSRPPLSSLLTARRPSWTPQLPSSVEYSPGTSRTSKSQTRTKGESAHQDPNSRRRPGPPSTLLTARGPSWSLVLPENPLDQLQKRRVNYQEPISPQVTLDPMTSSGEPSSPEDGGNFRRSLQIDMKGLVGDAVGNVSVLLSFSSSPMLSAHQGI